MMSIVMRQVLSAAAVYQVLDWNGCSVVPPERFANDNENETIDWIENDLFAISGLLRCPFDRVPWHQERAAPARILWWDGR